MKVLDVVRNGIDNGIRKVRTGGTGSKNQEKKPKAVLYDPLAMLASLEHPVYGFKNLS